MASTSNAKKKMSLQKKHNLIGWAFLIPASLLIFVFCFYPMFQAILLSFKEWEQRRPGQELPITAEF